MIDSSASASEPTQQLLPGQIPDTEGLQRREAQRRAQQLRVSRYRVDVDVSEAEDLTGDTYPVTTRIDFTVHEDATREGSVDTFVDYLGASVETVTLDGTELPRETIGSARIALTGLSAGEHVVEIVSHSRYSTSGEGMHRFQDPATVNDPDGPKVYLYTQYEPTDARRVFPNFEQPDLKAVFEFSLTGPADWVLASNESEISREEVSGSNGAAVTVRFAPTKPMSTYITTLLAGPYQVYESQWEGHKPTETGPIDLRVFCRASLAESMDADSVFETTRQGLTFFHDLYGISYPWGKYDQAFVPEYNLGAMENPGLVTFTESYVFTSTPTQAQYQGRATTIMHEMCHMWFGDLVTMRWWDDLWLKESFADFMGTLAVAEATEHGSGAWNGFAHGRKAWAYQQDAYPTTHPIVADIPDVAAAKQNFDGITYAKGASVLKQWVAHAGREAFMAACTEYFTRYAWGNAELNDFLEIVSDKAGMDLTGWAQDWLQTCGYSVLEVERAQNDTDSATLTQHSVDPVTGDTVNRPHTLNIGTFHVAQASDGSRNQRLVRAETTSARLESGHNTLSLDATVATADDELVVLPNDEDLTYATVRLDQPSTDLVLHTGFEDQLAAAVTWSNLWVAVRNAELPAAEFVHGVTRISPTVTDVSVHSRLLDQTVIAINRFAPEDQRGELRQVFGDHLIAGLETLGDGSDRQRSAARTLTALARRDAAITRHELLMLLGSDEPAHTSGMAPGLVVDDDIRWSILIALAGHHLVDQDRLDHELAAHVNNTNVLRHRTATVARADDETRLGYWRQVFTGTDPEGKKLSNDLLSATAEGLSVRGDTLLEDQWPELRENLVSIWTSRSVGLAIRTLNGLLSVHQPASSVIPDELKDWLDTHQDAPHDLRRHLMEDLTEMQLARKAQQLA